jgi:hypothetical protein
MPIETARPANGSGKRVTPHCQVAAPQQMRGDMKKHILSYVPAVSMLILGPLAFTDYAAAGSENAAEITSDFRCFVPNADWSRVVMGVSNNHSVVKKKNGTTVLRCSVKGVENTTGKAVHYFNFPCGTFMGTTFDSQLVISKSGHATMICRIHRGNQAGLEE